MQAFDWLVALLPLLIVHPSYISRCRYMYVYSIIKSGLTTFNSSWLYLFIYSEN